jgi:hypothetical protein
MMHWTIIPNWEFPLFPLFTVRGTCCRQLLPFLNSERDDTAFLPPAFDCGVWGLPSLLWLKMCLSLEPWREHMRSGKRPWIQTGQGLCVPGWRDAASSERKTPGSGLRWLRAQALGPGGHRSWSHGLLLGSTGLKYRLGCFWLAIWVECWAQLFQATFCCLFWKIPLPWCLSHCRALSCLPVSVWTNKWPQSGTLSWWKRGYGIHHQGHMTRNCHRWQDLSASSPGHACPVGCEGQANMESCLAVSSSGLF